jgi:hypothetical protein
VAEVLRPVRLPCRPGLASDCWLPSWRRLRGARLISGLRLRPPPPGLNKPQHGISEPHDALARWGVVGAWRAVWMDGQKTIQGESLVQHGNVIGEVKPPQLASLTADIPLDPVAVVGAIGPDPTARGDRAGRGNRSAANGGGGSSGGSSGGGSSGDGSSGGSSGGLSGGGSSGGGGFLGRRRVIPRRFLRRKWILER